MSETPAPRRALEVEDTSLEDAAFADMAVDTGDIENDTFGYDDEVIYEITEGADLPDTGEFDVVQDGHSPYTVALDDEGGVSFVEPQPDDASEVIVPSMVTAAIRTITPMLIGLILAGLTWAFTPLGVEIPTLLVPWLESTLPVVIGSLYYIAAKFLEQKFPSIPWLGSTRKPLYTPPNSVVGEIVG